MGDGPIMKNLDVKLLTILDTLLDERNVTRAAAKLNMTQSAVSHALARLRRDLDDPLFVPTRTGMSPTRRALELAEPLRAALEQLRRLTGTRTRFDPRECETVFRVSTNDYVGFVLLPRLLKRLAEEAPRVRLQVMALGTETDWDRLEDGTVDLAIAYMRSTPGQMHSRPLFQERYCCIARKKHPAIDGKLTLKTYLALDHIVMTPYITGVVDERLAEIGERRRVGIAIPQFLLIPELVTKSDMIATMGERVANDFAKRLPLTVHTLPLSLRPVTITAAWHTRKHHEPEHQWLRQLVAEVAANA